MDLYALPPEEFTAARDAAAKQDRSLKALRKPTVSAWVLNTLVRRDAAFLEELLSLGAALGQAQRDGQGDALRDLGTQRRQLIQAVTARALEGAGREVGSAVRLEVESTLEAAMADSASADALRSGRLVRPLSYSGFGDVDLHGAIAAETITPQVSKRAPSKGSETRAAEAAALTAAGLLDDAVRAADAASRAVELKAPTLAAAHAAEKASAEEVISAEAALRAAKDRRSAAQREREASVAMHEKLQERATAAAAAVLAAQQAESSARGALDHLRRHP